MSHDPPTTTHKITKERIDTEFLRNKLKLKSFETKNSFDKKFPHVKTFLFGQGLDFGKLREHSAKVIASSALTGTLLFTPPVMTTNLPNPTELIKNINELAYNTEVASPIPKNQLLREEIKNYLPDKVSPLTRTQEKNLEKVFQDIIGIKVRATLEGEHLNTTYGYIGAEQHLIRYPGDTLTSHDLTPDDEGMASGRGAWGYFAHSKSQLTPEDIDREKWYAVVQTLYLPDWSSRLAYLSKWYKYRKVLIVNTINGNALIADIADAGPAAFTGKQFGGSPSVMNFLGGSRYKKGTVIMFFVDDPENKVQLGPIDYNNTDIASRALIKI